MSKYDKRNLGAEYPYAYQQKLVLRYIKESFKGKERASMILAYDTITWIVSDFSKEDSSIEVNNWPKVMRTYSGMGIGTAQRCIGKLVEHGLIAYPHERNKRGKWDKWKVIIPKADDLPKKVLAYSTESGESRSGLTTTGETTTL